MSERRRTVVMATDQAPYKRITNAAGELAWDPKPVGGAAKVVDGHIWAALEQGDDVRLIACPKSPEEYAQAASGQPALREYVDEKLGVNATIPVYFVDVDQAGYTLGRAGIFATALWPRLHEMGGKFLKPFDYRAWTAYRETNRRTAALIDAVAPRDAEVIVHDMQLGLVSEFLGPKRPDLRTSILVHSGWSERLSLPEGPLRRIVQSLAAYDATIFQTRRYAQNFEQMAQALGTPANHVAAATVTIDANAVRKALRSEGTQKRIAELREQVAGRAAWLASGRADGYKRLPVLLETLRDRAEKGTFHPGRDMAMVVAQETRTDVPEYVEYWADLKQSIADFNAQMRAAFPDVQHDAILLLDDKGYDSPYDTMLAAMSLADYNLTLAINEGFGLTVPECALVNERDCVQVLSVSSGAYDRMKPSATNGYDAMAVELHPLSSPTEYRRPTADRQGGWDVHPEDIADTGRAMDAAMALSPQTRHRWAQLARAEAVLHTGKAQLSKMRRATSEGFAKRCGSPHQKSGAARVRPPSSPARESAPAQKRRAG